MHVVSVGVVDVSVGVVDVSVGVLGVSVGAACSMQSILLHCLGPGVKALSCVEPLLIAETATLTSCSVGGMPQMFPVPHLTECQAEVLS